MTPDSSLVDKLAPRESEIAPATTPELKALDRSIMSGLAWTGAAKWSVQALSWVSTIAVVRLLKPTDYGIVGMAGTFVAVLQPLCDFGVGAAIVQGRHLAEEQIAQLHGFAIMVGLICTLAAFALAFPAAAFFGEPALKAAIPVMGLTFLVGSLRIVPTAMLSRQMRFRRLAFIETIEAVCGLVTSIGLALAGWGYWSLIVATIVSRIVGSLLSLHASPQALLTPMPLTRITRSLRFGAWVALSSLAWYVYGNADRVVVGRLLGDAALGTYIMGLTLAAMPVEKVAQLYQRVSESVVSRVQHDPIAVGRYLLGITEGVAMISFPLSVGLMLVADQFVHVVLGPSWTAAIVPLRILAGAAALRSLDPLLAQVLILTGHASVNARSMALATLLLPVAFWIGARWGVAGVATVWLVGHPGVLMTRQVWCVLRISHSRLSQYLGALAPATSCTVLMALAVVGFRAAFGTVAPEIVMLAGSIAVGVAAYVASMFIFHRGRIRLALALIRQSRGAEPAVAAGAPGV